MDGHVMKRVTTPKLFSTVYLVHWCRNGARPATDNNSLGEIYHRRRLGKQRSNSRLFFPRQDPVGKHETIFHKETTIRRPFVQENKISFQKKVIHCLFCPPPRTLGQLCPWGSWMRPKFSSRSRMSLRALRDLKYGRGALATCSPTPGSTLPVGVMASLAA